MSPLLASRLQSLRVGCRWEGDERPLAGVLSQCSVLQSLTLKMEIFRMGSVLSALPHPLHAVREFELDTRGFYIPRFEVSHVPTVLRQLPALSKFTARVRTFSDRARALCAARAPNCELEVVIM